MGILNVTPDSFFDGGLHSNDNLILQHVEMMLQDGADIIDVGAYSSRPGADNVDLKTELKRLDNALKIIRKKFPDTILSIDTFRAEIAEKMHKRYHIDIINDISAGELDDNMFETIAKIKVPYVLMHMQGNPSNMQNNPAYKNVVQDIILFLSKKIKILKSLGVNDIILDPGFGFGKSVEHNYKLLSKLDHFKIFDLPILVGVSRKSFIYKPLEISPKEALNATTVWHTISLLNGANILRVHDVKQAKETIKIMNLFGS